MDVRMHPMVVLFAAVGVALTVGGVWLGGHAQLLSLVGLALLALAINEWDRVRQARKGRRTV